MKRLFFFDIDGTLIECEKGIYNIQEEVWKLLDDLKKHTPSNHPDYENLIEGCKVVSEVAFKVNDYSKQFEHFERVNELDEKISNYNKDVQNEVELFKTETIKFYDNKILELHNIIDNLTNKIFELENVLEDILNED
jgi:hydroxymethylpyrimidine pyrophosphatase-like HAD family hydrolase